MIRIVLVDDEAKVRYGLKMRLALEADMLVVGEASAAEAALTLVRTLRPDVVVMDIRMLGMDGIIATAVLKTIAPQSAIVILSLHGDPATRARALAAGASAFVEKKDAGEALLTAIRTAAK
jgi:DNA-binding NarL/FixJ family response regulator